MPYGYVVVDISINVRLRVARSEALRRAWLRIMPPRLLRTQGVPPILADIFEQMDYYPTLPASGCNAGGSHVRRKKPPIARISRRQIEEGGPDFFASVHEICGIFPKEVNAISATSRLEPL